MGAQQEPISAQPLREQVYMRLQELMISRTFAPGDHLVEEALARRLGVSRGPVREALQRLQRDGWVTLRPRRGAFVSRPTPQQVLEFFEARELLEGAATRLAARRITPEGGAALLRLCDEAVEDLRRGSSPEHMAAQTARFHLMVLRGSGNHLLEDLGHQLSARSRWFFTPLVADRAPRGWVEHRRIASRIAAGRAEEAAAAMQAHIEGSRLAYLDRQGAETSAPQPDAPRVGRSRPVRRDVAT
jgi:DNA-binding GntR family transcriptional regulator